MAKTPKKTKTSETGAQYYQSDRNRKARLKVGGGRTEMDDLIRQAVREKMLSGEISPERAGEMDAGQFIDSIDDAYSSKRKK